MPIAAARSREKDVPRPRSDAVSATTAGAKGEKVPRLVCLIILHRKCGLGPAEIDTHE